MKKKTVRPDSISGKIKQLAVDCAKADELPEKERGKRYTYLSREFKRFIGLEKAHSRFQCFSSNTVMSYLRRARTELWTSVLVSSDFYDILAKIEKTCPEHEETIKHILKSKKKGEAKKRYQEARVSKETPEELRAILKNLNIEHPVYYRLMSTKGRGAELLKAKMDKASNDKKAVLKKNKGTSLKCANVSLELIEKAVEAGLDPKQPHANKIALALVICTGRRPIELFKLGSFKIENDSTLLFDGQAKKKHGEKPEAYEIPVLFSTAQKVLNAFKRLRQHAVIKKLENMTNEDIDSRMSGSIVDCARTSLKNNNIVFYSARSIYAHIAYKEYENRIDELKKIRTYKGGKLSKTGHASTLLGHSGKDIGSAMSYEGIDIDEHYTGAQATEDYKEQLLKKKTISKIESDKPHAELDKLYQVQTLSPVTISNGRALNTRLELVEWVIDACKNDPDFRITATNIRKLKGGRMEPIKSLIEDLEKI